MTGAGRLVRAIVATLPVHARPRDREEWLADLDGAAELGIPRAAVVVGAAATAASVDRLDPAVTGMPRGAVALRRGRWAGAFLGTAAVLGIGSLVLALPVAVQVLAGIALLVGILLAAGALVAALGGGGGRRALVGLGVVAAGVLGLAALAFVPLLGVLAVVGGGAVLVVLLAVAGADGRPAVRSRGIRALAAAPFSAAILVVGALGVLLGIGITVLGGWFAGFALGMGIADTFFVSGGDAAWTGSLLAVIGQAALVGTLFAALPPPRLREPAPER